MSIAAMMMSVFCVLCYTGQNFFNKLYAIRYTGPSTAATPVFSAIYGLLTGFATWAYNGFRFQPGAATLALGLLCGGMLFLFNLSLINASRSGPYAFQSIMMLFGNTLLPLLFSVLWWGDRLTALQITGIVVMLLSFVIFNLKGLHFAGLKKGYFLWVGLLFLSNGCYGILMDSQQRVMGKTQRSEMIITTFLISALISLIYLALTQGKQAPKAFRMGGKNWACALCSSICAALAINLLMLALRLVPASILFTVNNGGVLILCALLGTLVFHEKLEKNMVAGLAVAVLSLAILGL